MGQPLNVGQFADQPLSILIYWRPRTGLDSLQNGHSALIIDAQRFDVFSRDYYVSWMGAAGGVNPFVHTGQPQTFYADMQQWGGYAAPNNLNFCVPTRWVAIRNLNIDLMTQEWDNIRNKPNAHWKLVDKNCATCVARVLKAGGGDAYATRAQNQLIWWPTDLVTYTRSMGAQVVATS